MHDDEQLRRTTDDDRLRRIEHMVYGNGQAGMAERLRRLERFMFEDPTTGDKGLVNDVKSLTDAVNSFRTTLRTLNWLLLLVGVGGVVAFVRSVLGLG